MTIAEIVHSAKGAITVADAAAVLGCDPRTVSRAIAEGKVPSIPLGRRQYIPVAPFLAMLGLEWQGGDQ